MTRTRPLKLIWLLALLMTLGMPLLNTLFIAPRFVDQMVTSVEDIATKVCHHASRSILTEQNWNDWLSKGMVPDYLAAAFADLRRDLQLIKIKFYLGDGRTVYSSDLSDVGKDNEDSSFYDLVSKGRVFSTLTRKATPSAGKETGQRDVVQTYVPVMDQGRFVGAFELYANVTDEIETMHALAWRATLIPALAALVFLSLFSLLLWQLSRQLIAREQTEQDLLAALDASWGLTEELEERRQQEEFSHRSLAAAHQALRENQEQLRQQEKLLFAGQLASGLASEIDPPLAGIENNLSSLGHFLKNIYPVLDDQRRRLVASRPGAIKPRSERLWTAEEVDRIKTELSRLVDESLAGTERVRTILQGLEVFHLLDSDDERPVDLQTCLEKSLRQLHAELGPQIRVCRQFGVLPPVTGSVRQFREPFRHLLNNAVQALEGGGELRLKTWQDDGKALVAISDTGTGMLPGVRERVFDPFFTTRPGDQSIGLGMTIAWAIVRHHRGDISILSEPGKGTTITVRLPLAGDLSLAEVSSVELSRSHRRGPEGQPFGCPVAESSAPDRNPLPAARGGGTG